MLIDPPPAPPVAASPGDRAFWLGQLRRAAAAPGRPLRGSLHFEQAPSGAATHDWPLTAGNRELVARLSRGRPIGEFVVLAAALAILVHRYSGETDIRLDTPRLAELDPAPGDGVVPLVLQVSADATLRAFLLEAQRIVSESFTRQDGLDPGLWTAGGAPGAAELLVFDGRLHSAPRKLEHELAFETGVGEGGGVRLHDAAGRFPAGFAERMGRHLNVVVAQLSALETRLADVRMLDEREERELLETFNQTDDPALATAPAVPALFAARARATPDALAVLAEGGARLSYGALQADASRLAHHLATDLGIRPGDAVAVLSDRSELAVVAILGVLAAGAAYVPLNPRDASERMRRVLDDVGARALLVHSRYLEQVSEFYDLPTFCTDLQLPSLPVPASAPERPVAPGDAAAVIYTSGSEGAPKGVVIEHRGLANVALDHVHELRMGAGDRYLQFMSLSFDGSLLDVFTGLLAGATLVMVSEETLRSADRFQAWLEEAGVTVFTVTPSYLKLLDPERLRGVRAIISAAEPAKPSDAQLYSRSKDFYNGYGPTEACVNATLHRVEAGRSYGAVPVGRPRANKRVYLLDARQRLLPGGAVGEIALSGVGLARGYLNDPALTARKFVAHPFIPGERLYLTGDLGAWNERGELCFLGRRDDQVKIRGFRVEPGEIEQALLQHPSVRDAVVLFDPAHGRLAAFYTERAPASETELTGFLGARLPEYMVPALVCRLPALPTTANGKVDRAALLARAAERLRERHRAAEPENEVEAALADAWRGVLELPSVDTDADFFRLGGDSIRVIQAVQEARRRGIDVSTTDLIAHRTVKALARHVYASGRFGAPAPATPAPAAPQPPGDGLPPGWEDAFPATRMQEAIIRAYDEPAYAAGAAYHCVALWHLRDPAFTPAALRDALRALVQRHGTLRTVFHGPGPDGRRMQVVLRSPPTRIRELDLRELPPDAQRDAIDRALRDDVARRFEVLDAEAPLVRFTVFLRSETDFALLLSAHHAVIDGWSGVEIENDLFDLYGALKGGAAVDERRVAPEAGREFAALEAEIEASAPAARFWAEELARAAAEPLPARYASPGAEPFGTLTADLGAGLSAGVRRAAAREGVSLKAVCLSAFLTALHEHTGTGRATVGLVANGRSDRLTSPLRATGLFWNVVPLVSDARAAGGTTPRALQGRLDEIERYARYPLARMLADAGRDDALDACFNFIQFHNARAVPVGVELLGFEAVDRFHHPVTCVVSVVPDAADFRLDVRIEYRRSHFGDADVRALLHSYQAAAERLAG